MPPEVPLPAPLPVLMPPAKPLLPDSARMPSPSLFTPPVPRICCGAVTVVLEITLYCKVALLVTVPGKVGKLPFTTPLPMERMPLLMVVPPA